MPGPGGHHHSGGGRGGMGGGPRPGGMHGGPGHHGGPRPGGMHGGMGHRPMGHGGMHHHHRPAPPPSPPMHGSYPRRPYRGGCCGCAIPAFVLAFAGIAGILAIIF